MTIKKTKLMLQFEAETGKYAIWREKITANFKKWAAQKEKRGKAIRIRSASETNLSSNINSKLEVILNQFQDFDRRLSKLENIVFKKCIKK